VIGHPLVMPSLPHFPWDLGKYKLCDNKAYGLICMSMSLEILFHIESCTTPNDIWIKFGDGSLWKMDKMRGHMLEAELNLLDPRNFDNIQDLFKNFKSLLNHIKGCGIDKSTQHNQLILSILEKLGLDYVVFISSLHKNRFTLEAT
jgi:hypothetical protein